LLLLAKKTIIPYVSMTAKTQKNETINYKAEGREDFKTRAEVFLEVWRLYLQRRE
jgi:hypothetical protein